MHADEPSVGDFPTNTFALIVGGGPVGVTAALSLARYGYSSIIVERHAERLGQPKAHFLNSRTLEIFRQLKLDMSPLRQSGLQPDEADAVRFVSSMVGTEFGVIDFRQDEDQFISPETVFNVSQPYLEEFLLHSAVATGKVDFRRMHEWQHCAETYDGFITSGVLCRRTNTMVAVKSKYLLGCDGANSRSRENLGINFGPALGDTEQVLHYASVHFSANLSHLKTGVLWFVLGQSKMSVLIAYDRKKSWVFFTAYNPEVTPKESLTSEYFKVLVNEAIGEAPADYQELGITVWTTSPRLAEVYRSPRIRNGFLAGDAAHSFPPTGGLGVNTGVADVQNLVWKLHAIEQGWTRSSFLDTVTTERRPVALENSRQSRVNEDKIFRLAATILRLETTAEELMADPISRKRIKDAIDENWEHFHSPNLQVGYIYNGAPTRGPADYQKELIPGARLAHCWLLRQKAKISSLDLISGTEFVLITPQNFTTLEKFNVDETPVSVQQLGRDFEDIDGEWKALLAQVEGAAIFVRPDHHIIGSMATIEKAKSALARYLQCTSSE